MKELAKQTANATGDISRKITAIQDDTKGAIAAIATVSGVINKINDISATIAAAVEEQSATTNEMTRNASEAASGAGEISTSIVGVTEAANGTLTRAQESQKAAQELAAVATQLSSLMRQFKIERSEGRMDIALPVRLAAIDFKGDPVDEEVTTINVSHNGALLTGVRSKLRQGSQVSLARGNKVDQFVVVWLGEEGTDQAGQIGVSAVNNGSSFWNDVVESQPEARLAGAEGSHPRQAGAKATAKAHSS